MASKRTKNMRAGYWVTLTFNLLLTFGPLLGYLIYGFIVAEPKEKIGLSAVTICAIVLGAISAICKLNLRSTLWVLLLGLYWALGTLLEPLIIIASCTILNEFVVEPLNKSYKAKLITNKEIDKRGL